MDKNRKKWMSGKLMSGIAVALLATATFAVEPLKVALYVDDGCRGTGVLRWAEIFRDFPLDVALLPATVEGEKGLALMRTIVEQYFSNGGMVIQFNVHDPKTLRDAQTHPEKYENLQVRVCGWNVRWNDIPKVEQDKFILRQEMISQ